MGKKDKFTEITELYDLDSIKRFPLIELHEENASKNIELVLQGIQDVFAFRGLTALGEAVDYSHYKFSFSHNDNDFLVPVNVVYDADLNYIVIEANYGIFGKSILMNVAETVNMQNNVSPPVVRFSISPRNDTIKIDAGMFVTGWFDTHQLLLTLKYLLFNVSYLRLFEKVILKPHPRK